MNTSADKLLAMKSSLHHITQTELCTLPVTLQLLQLQLSQHMYSNKIKSTNPWPAVLATDQLTKQ